MYKISLSAILFQAKMLVGRLIQICNNKALQRIQLTIMRSLQLMNMPDGCDDASFKLMLTSNSGLEF